MGKAIVFIGLSSVLLAGCVAGAPPAGDPPAPHYAPVQAMLNAQCVGCHGNTNPRAGINLTSYANVMKGGRGPIVKAGDPAASLLVKALRGVGARQMPPRGKVDEAKIKAVEAWIKAGAKNS